MMATITMKVGQNENQTSKCAADLMTRESRGNWVRNSKGTLQQLFGGLIDVHGGDVPEEKIRWWPVVLAPS